MNCCLCGTQKLVVLTTRLRDRPGKVWYCDACELGMLERKPSNLKKYYDEKYRKHYSPRVNQTSSYAEIFESYVHYQTQRVQLLRPWLRQDMRLLDVGCQTGHFLFNIKNLVKEVVGVDYDSGAADFASKVCQCTTFGCGLDETGLPPASFDVVCAMQTMEHVADPVSFASTLGKYLKLNGIIYIEVPNLKDALLSVYNNQPFRDFYYREAHILYLTQSSLEAVMSRAGFEGTIHFLQDYNFLNHLHWNFIGQPQPSCHDGMGVPKLPSVGVEGELRKDLEDWAKHADMEYKSVLIKHGISDNIAFIGKLVKAN